MLDERDVGFDVQRQVGETFGEGGKCGEHLALRKGLVSVVAGVVVKGVERQQQGGFALSGVGVVADEAGGECPAFGFASQTEQPLGGPATDEAEQVATEIVTVFSRDHGWYVSFGFCRGECCKVADGRPVEGGSPADVCSVFPSPTGVDFCQERVNHRPQWFALLGVGAAFKAGCGGRHAVGREAAPKRPFGKEGFDELAIIALVERLAGDFSGDGNRCSRAVGLDSCIIVFPQFVEILSRGECRHKCTGQSGPQSTFHHSKGILNDKVSEKTPKKCVFSLKIA